MDEIAVDGWELDEDGRLRIPDTPGLGSTLDMGAVARYACGALIQHLQSYINLVSKSRCDKR